MLSALFVEFYQTKWRYYMNGNSPMRMDEIHNCNKIARVKSHSVGFIYANFMHKIWIIVSNRQSGAIFVSTSMHVLLLELQWNEYISNISNISKMNGENEMDWSTVDSTIKNRIKLNIFFLNVYEKPYEPVIETISWLHYVIPIACDSVKKNLCLKCEYLWKSPAIQKFNCYH